MPSDRFILAASHAGETVDIWRFNREPARCVEWSCEYPTYHHTTKDGEHPHFTAQDGLESAPVHPIVIEAVKEAKPDEKPKRHPMGWPTRWSDIEDYQTLSGMTFMYPDDLPRFPRSSPRSRGQRLVVPLDVDQGVQAMHTLAWPTDATRAFIVDLCSMPGTVDVRLLARWEPWSVIHVQVTKPNAVQRSRPTS